MKEAKNWYINWVQCALVRFFFTCDFSELLLDLIFAFRLGDIAYE